MISPVIACHTSVMTQKYRYIKRRPFPHGIVARRCHSHSYVASSRLALRKSPSVLFASLFLCHDTSISTWKYRYIKRRLFPHGIVVRRCHSIAMSPPHALPCEKIHPFYLYRYFHVETLVRNPVCFSAPTNIKVQSRFQASWVSSTAAGAVRFASVSASASNVCLGFTSIGAPCETRMRLSELISAH